VNPIAFDLLSLRFSEIMQILAEFMNSYENVLSVGSTNRLQVHGSG